MPLSRFPPSFVVFLFFYLFGVCVFSLSLSFPPHHLARHRRRRRLFHLLPSIYRLLSGGKIDMATLFSQLVHPRRLPTPLTIYDRIDRQNRVGVPLMFVVLSATPLNFKFIHVYSVLIFLVVFLLLSFFQSAWNKRHHSNFLLTERHWSIFKLVAGENVV